MDAIPPDLSAPGLLVAADENEAAYWLRRAYLAGWEMCDEGDLTWYRSGRYRLLANGIVQARLEPEIANARIAAALAHFTAHNLPVAWFVGPAHRPANLGERLEAHGLRCLGREPGMAVGLHALRDDIPQPDGLTIERVRNEDTLATWLRAYRNGEAVSACAPPVLMESCVPKRFGEDEPLRLFLARLDGMPVATAQLLLAAGVAGIYGVATLPAARRQGIGAAVTRAALLHARTIGYRVGVLQATALGHGVYERLGFVDCCEFHLYGRLPS